jgi:hypothetical protein
MRVPSTRPGHEFTLISGPSATARHRVRCTRARLLRRVGDAAPAGRRPATER